MNNKEKVLKYMSGLLSESEELAFRDELEKNPELSKLYTQMTRNISELKNAAKVEFDDRYFSNRLANLHTKKSKRRFAVPAMAFGSVFSVLLIISVYILVPFSSPDNELINFSEDEIASLFENADSTDIYGYINSADIRLATEDYYNLEDSLFIESLNEVADIYEENNDYHYINSYPGYENGTYDEYEVYFNALKESEIL